MTRETYLQIERYAIGRMGDSAHDMEHVYRVLHNALIIAEGEGADCDVLIAACLLHDIGREAQFADPRVCHAQAGAAEARDYLVGTGWSEPKAEAVAACIRSHRYRGDKGSLTFEAMALYDADKLDAAGAVGIARTFMYSGIVGQPMYTLADLSPGGREELGDKTDSFVSEYRYKLINIYDGFFTGRGRELALGRKRTAENFFEGFMSEITSAEDGANLLIDALLD